MQVSADKATIKAHGYGVGDTIMFHGMGSGLPSNEPTACVLSKAGAKYVLTAIEGKHYNGAPITWEFGASAAIWASPVESVTVTERMSGDVTLYSAKCAHGWETGAYANRADAEAVAIGHGEVFIPTYEPSAEPTVDADDMAMMDSDIVRVVARLHYFSRVLVTGAAAHMDVLPEHVEAARQAGLVFEYDEWLTVTSGAMELLTEADKVDAFLHFNPRHEVPMPRVGQRFLTEDSSTIHTVTAVDGDTIFVRHSTGGSANWSHGWFSAWVRNGQMTEVPDPDEANEAREERAAAQIAPLVGDVVYRERDGHQGVITDVNSDAVSIRFAGGIEWSHRLVDLIGQGYEVIPADEYAAGIAAANAVIPAVAPQREVSESFESSWDGWTAEACERLLAELSKRRTPRKLRKAFRQSALHVIADMEGRTVREVRQSVKRSRSRG